MNLCKFSVEKQSIKPEQKEEFDEWYERNAG